LLLLGFAQAEIRFGQIRVPLDSFAVAMRRRRVFSLVEIEIADAHLFFRLQRVERVLFWLFGLVFFGRGLLFLCRRRLLRRWLLTGGEAHNGHPSDNCCGSPA
jgi:hypothetical protein